MLRSGIWRPPGRSSQPGTQQTGREVSGVGEGPAWPRLRLQGALPWGRGRGRQPGNGGQGPARQAVLPDKVLSPGHAAYFRSPPPVALSGQRAVSLHSSVFGLGQPPRSGGRRLSSPRQPSLTGLLPLWAGPIGHICLSLGHSPHAWSRHVECRLRPTKPTRPPLAHAIAPASSETRRHCGIKA